MASQRLTVATLIGQSAMAIIDQFERWRSVPDQEAVDQLCDSICKHSLSLPVIYFTEWVDRWLMGDSVPGPNAVDGRRFQATCLSPVQARGWADKCGSQFVEHGWLANRLREAAAVWSGVSGQNAIVVTREVFGLSITDEEIQRSAQSIPEWLGRLDRDTKYDHIA